MKPSVIARIWKTFPAPVWVLFLGTFLNRFGTFVVPFLTLYLTRRGYSLADASLALIAYGIGHFFASAIGGHLADRFGRRNTIAFSMFSAALAMLALWRAESLPAIIVLTGVTGLVSEIYRPASSALLADLVEPNRRVTAYAAYRIAINSGWAFGPATAGFLAEHSFAWLFVGDAVTSAMFGVVALIALPHGTRVKKEQSGWAPALAHVRNDKPFLAFLVASFAVGLVFFQMSSTYGLEVNHRGFSEKMYGALISLNGVIVVLFELPITAVTRRYSAPLMMSIGYVLVGFGFFLAILPGGLGILLVAIIVFTFGEMLAMPIASAYVADLAPVQFRGRYMGLVGLTWAVALMVGPSTGLRLFAESRELVWLLCGISGVVAAVAMQCHRRIAAPDCRHRTQSPLKDQHVGR